MNYAELYKTDLANGKGVRVTLFVSGCLHDCKGCYNKKAQHPKFGQQYTEDTKWEIIDALKERDGLSLTGGDPLYPRNRDAILDLVQTVKQIYPEKNIWMWTGHTHKEVSDLEILKFVDVLVDGKYEKDLPMAEWRGSSNQQIIQLGG